MAWKKEHSRDGNFVLISLILHVAVLVVIAGYPVGEYIQEQGSAIFVEWVEKLPDHRRNTEPPKSPIPKKPNPDELGLKGRRMKQPEAPPRKPMVKVKSDRIVDRTVEINKGPRSDHIPDIMTDTPLKDSLSSISGLVSTDEGPIDGRGIVGDQVRASGSGRDGLSGSSLLGLDGLGDGLAGTGGGGGILDRLGIISFMNESDGPQKIVYCLDISASMANGSKLPVSVRSLKESMMQLGDFDEFNIITFHSSVEPFQKNSVPATMENIEKASRFLDSFTPVNIENNLGTDILTALRHALSMQPAVIVLITDIQPTRGEVDENKIAEEVRKINKNNTRIYGIGVETWEPRPDGRMAKLLKILTEQNGGQMRLAGSG